MSEARVAKGVATEADHSEGMSFLSTLPQRVVRTYIPLALIVFVLLFPFYWMTMTAIKPKEHLLDLDAHSPFYTLTPTLEHINDLLFKTDYPLWLWNTMFIAVAATILSLIASVFAAYAITRIRFSTRSGWAARSSWPTSCRRRSCSSRCRRWSTSTGCSTRRSR